jgi:hypothetical protein
MIANDSLSNLRGCMDDRFSIVRDDSVCAAESTFLDRARLSRRSLARRRIPGRSKVNDQAAQDSSNCSANPAFGLRISDLLPVPVGVLQQQSPSI